LFGCRECTKRAPATMPIGALDYLQGACFAAMIACG
jgi:hypothetical protein